ncbi:MAG: hypothetical protein WBA17_11620 [Saprospiraceae bacterium]
MRNLLLFALVLTGTLFTTGCGDDDDGTSINKEQLVGTWKVTVLDTDADASVTGFGASNTVSSISNSTLTITFLENNTYTSTGSYTETSTTTEAGSAPVTDVEDFTGGIGNGTWSITGGKLVIDDLETGGESDVDAPVTFDVRNFVPDAEIVLFSNVQESFTDPFIGLMIDLDADIDMRLEK